VGAQDGGRRQHGEQLFEVVAVDDLSPHVWTLDELKADVHVNGFAFADHESWRKLHKVQSHTLPAAERGRNGA